jgi:hypothetical protein
MAFVARQKDDDIGPRAVSDTYSLKNMHMRSRTHRLVTAAGKSAYYAAIAYSTGRQDIHLKGPGS